MTRALVDFIEAADGISGGFWRAFIGGKVRMVAPSLAALEKRLALIEMPFDLTPKAKEQADHEHND